MHVGQTNNELNGMSYTSIAVLATWIRNQLLTTAIHLSVSRIVVEVYHAMSNPLNEPPTRQLWHYYQIRTGSVRRHRMVINQEGEAPSKGSRLGLQCDPSTPTNPTPSRPPRPLHLLLLLLQSSNSGASRFLVPKTVLRPIYN